MTHFPEFNLEIRDNDPPEYRTLIAEALLRLDSDPQERLNLIFSGFNEAFHDILDATGPHMIRHGDEPGVYEVDIRSFWMSSTLTTEVIHGDSGDRLEPVNFQTRGNWPCRPNFSYSRDGRDAATIRLMTCWLERAFLIHQPAILEGIRALTEAENEA